MVILFGCPQGESAPQPQSPSTPADGQPPPNGGNSPVHSSFSLFLFFLMIHNMKLSFLHLRMSFDVVIFRNPFLRLDFGSFLVLTNLIEASSIDSAWVFNHQILQFLSFLTFSPIAFESRVGKCRNFIA